MSVRASKSRRRLGCLAWLLILVLSLGACYWLLLAPLPERREPVTGTPAPETSGGIVVEGQINPKQQSALENLAAGAGGQAEVLAQNGRIQYLSVNVQVPDAAAASLQEKASYFLQQNWDLLQVEDPNREFRPSGKSVDEYGATFFRYEQVYKGIPVYGSETIVELSDRQEIKSVMAGYSPDLEINIQPAIRSIRAEEIVRKDAGSVDAKPAVPTRLVIFDTGFMDETISSSPRLAWEVVIPVADYGVRSYLVDAQTGDILESFDELISALDRRVWDAQRKPNLKDELWIIDLLYYSKSIMDEKGPIGSHQPIDDARRAWEHTGIVYKYYYDHFGRDSIDGKGGTIDLYVNIGNCRNSYWSLLFGKAIFCDGYTSQDIVSHELTHGIYARGMRGYYKYQAAALTKSFQTFLPHLWMI